MRWWAVLAGVPLVCAAAGCTGSAQADPPEPVTETDCRDIVSGAAVYERDQLVPGLPISRTDYPEALKVDGGTVRARFDLAAPACSGVEYGLRVFGADGSVIREDVAEDMKGLMSVRFTTVVSEYSHDCLAVQAWTRQRGLVADRAPDALETFELLCDGRHGDVLYQ